MAKAANLATEDMSNKRMKKDVNIPPAKTAVSKLKVVGQRRESWVASSVICSELGEDERYVRNVEKLLREDHTIPFIARYRKELTGDMSTDKLIKIKEQIARLDNLSKKITKSLIDIDKLGQLSPNLGKAIMSCVSAVTLEQVTAAYKPGKKKSRAEQAKALGLEATTHAILKGAHVNILSLVGTKEELKTEKNVVDGIKDIIAEFLRNNKDVLECCERIGQNRDNQIETTKSKSKDIPDDIRKFDLYLKGNFTFGSIRSHQVMAINRGEKLKILSVKITLPERCQNVVKSTCYQQLKHMMNGTLRVEIIDDSCSRLIFPLIARQVRARLTEEAVGSSIDVFAQNLKHLLLTPPMPGLRLLAIDPGFSHGCKLAVLGERENVLETGIIYLKGSRFSPHDQQKLLHLTEKHSIDTIAIGNGTACRESEKAITNMIQSKVFQHPIKYCIVDERGASIYSVTDLAVKELPNLDTNIRSAVSIGRRVLNPLSEYVKIEPKHLGVGQYQHDIPATKLSERLEETVEECVSFTGLDLNHCSHHMLERIAGLSKARAAAILAWRDQHGTFTNRDQVNSVKGIGPKSFEQCIGFLRIYPKSGVVERPDHNSDDEDADYVDGKRKRKLKGKGQAKKKVKVHTSYLDQTSVHPESYKYAETLIQSAGLKLKDIGTKNFVSNMKSKVPASVYQELGCTEGTAKCIITALSQDLTFDFREQFSKPLFKTDILTESSVSVGTKLEGRISNVTHFGAFVDIGLARDGLIHVSNSRGTALSLGQRVTTTVVQISEKGIGLRLIEVL